MPKGIYKRSDKQIKHLKDLSNRPRTLRNGGYYAIHKWLKKYYGKANKCENPFCEKKSLLFHWAKLKDKPYEHKKENFIQLCVICHRRYDDSPERGIKAGKSRSGIKMPDKQKEKISKSCKGIHIGNKHSAKKIIQTDFNGNVIKIWTSISEAALKLNISASGITMCTRGQIKKSGGFKWSYVDEDEKEKIKLFNKKCLLCLIEYQSAMKKQIFCGISCQSKSKGKNYKNIIEANKHVID